MRKDNLVIPQGADWTVSWSIISPETGQPVENLLAWEAHAQARPAVASTQVLFEWSTNPTGNQGEIVLADGRLKIFLKAEESTAWSWRTAVYDIELTSPDDKVTRISGGSIRVIPEVTRV
jgi:hypothetical protein